MLTQSSTAIVLRNAMVFLLRNCCRWDVSVAYSKTRLKPNLARLLFLESPTPCAWTYANNAGEVPRKMTLIAEAALCRYTGKR